MSCLDFNNYRGLRETRIFRGVSIEEMSKLADITIEDIIHYESNPENIPLNIAKKISKALRVSIDHIDFVNVG
ncbi:DNA-binding XRE family transcriptional regulator [Fontibacillus solani]|uniref:DNA-binding XRE family transcriptional regulator n=1 Tax=Fontibacillus solani TaxID=1572857 RepID=A0A7W3SUU5_9BACL|nr:helix-turn-helix transcriptional regulator [Fontibacillus solani]MBA9086670.1 DNA-binding XRE family transcriptional regulator [Fontibacillus solani]